MAATPDNHTIQTNGSASSGSPMSFAYVTAGAELYLIVGVVSGGGTTAVTYNGVALTKVATEVLSALVAISLDWWALIAPASGSNTLVITPTSGAPDGVIAMVSSWNGIDQSTPLGTKVSSNIDAQTQEFVTASPSCLYGEIAVAIGTTYNRTVVGANGTTLLDTSNPFGAQAGMHGYKLAAAKGTNAVEDRFSWTGGGNQVTAEIAYPLRPSTYPPPSGTKPNVMRPRPFKPGLAR